MGVVDADAHVIETLRTWSFMLEEDVRFAPELLVSTKSGVEFWRIDERVLPNFVEYAGQDNLMVGTDYGHADYSNDIEVIQTLARSGKVSPSLAQRIVGDNPKRLYGL